MAKINVKPDICDVKMSEIKPAPYNPREISDAALAGLRQSLAKFGLVDLLVVNRRNMRIISGHQRYKILQQEGVEDVTVIMVDLDEISEMAMNLPSTPSRSWGRGQRLLFPSWRNYGPRPQMTMWRFV